MKMTRPALRLFSIMYTTITVTGTLFLCLSFFGTGCPTFVKADLELYTNATSLRTINICNITELNEFYVTSGAAVLYAGENNKTGECSVTMRVGNQGTVQLGIINSPLVLDYASNYVYIKTSPNTSDVCGGRIVAFPKDLFECFILFAEDFKIHLKGDSRLIVQPTGLTNSESGCPYVDKLIQNVHANTRCKQPIMFNEVVYCQLYEDNFQEYYRPLPNTTACNFICPVNSPCTLGRRTITTSYPNGTLKNYLLVYPDIQKITTLYWGNRRMNNLKLGTFNTFILLETLFLQGNKVTLIYPGLFNSLIKLRALYLSGQIINEIQPGNVFNDLSNLERLIPSFK